MKNLSKSTIGAVFLSAIMTAAIAGQSFGQTNPADTGLVNLQAVNTTQTAVLPLKSLPEKKEGLIIRTPFVKRVTVNLNGFGVSVVAMQIPAGKRLVIENVTAIIRSAESQRVEVDYSTYANNGGVADKTIHQLVLEKQASFKESAIFTASQKEIVFADEQIGGEHFSVGVSARLRGGSTQFAQGQFTFSGYLEDLPTI